MLILINIIQPENYPFLSSEYASVLIEEENSLYTEFTIYVNNKLIEEDEKITGFDVFGPVIAHEFGHIFNQINGYEDTEENADDFAFDFCEENGIDTRIFKHFHELNQVTE